MRSWTSSRLSTWCVIRGLKVTARAEGARTHQGAGPSAFQVQRFGGVRRQRRVLQAELRARPVRQGVPSPLIRAARPVFRR